MPWNTALVYFLYCNKVLKGGYFIKREKKYIWLEVVLQTQEHGPGIVLAPVRANLATLQCRAALWREGDGEGLRGWKREGKESKTWERGEGAEELYHVVGLKPERLCYTPPHRIPLPRLGTHQGS